MAVFLLVIVILVLEFLASMNSTKNEEPPTTDEPTIYQSRPITREKNHFINKHLHRDDKKHDRHRRNQFPQ